MTDHCDQERFRSGAAKYAAYLETPDGRLRLDLVFANLQEFMPPSTGPLRVLDVGCGTGAIALRLAALGIHVTLLDSSLPMLDCARHAAQAAALVDRVELKYGDATQLANLFPAGSFDVILCHDVLEYVEDPAAVLHGSALALKDASGILSIVVRNRAGEVFKAAIQSGDLGVANHNLTAEWANESLYGGSVRLFTPDTLRAMLKVASLVATGERGVRVMSDYLPPQVSRSAEYERIFELERKLGSRPEFAGVARYMQWLASRRDPQNPAKEEGA